MPKDWTASGATEMVIDRLSEEIAKAGVGKVTQEIGVNRNHFARARDRSNVDVKSTLGALKILGIEPGGFFEEATAAAAEILVESMEASDEEFDPLADIDFEGLDPRLKGILEAAKE